MARTTDQIQADIDAVLGQAGVLESEVQYADGRRVSFRGEAERQRALQSLRQELAQIEHVAPRTRQILFFADKGL